MTITTTEQKTTRWTVDVEDASAGFAVKTFWGLATVHGRFDRFDGSYEVGPDGPKIELTIDAGSLDTGNKTRDKHLRSTEFFRVDEHPHGALQLDTRPQMRATGCCTSRAVSKRGARLCRSSSTPMCSRSTTGSRSRRRRRSTSGSSV